MAIEIVELPIKNGDFPSFFFKRLPEGTPKKTTNGGDFEIARSLAVHKNHQRCSRGRRGQVAVTLEFLDLHLERGQGWSRGP